MKLIDVLLVCSCYRNTEIHKIAKESIGGLRDEYRQREVIINLHTKHCSCRSTFATHGPAYINWCAVGLFLLKESLGRFHPFYKLRRSLG